MKFQALLHIFTFLSVILVGSHAALPSEVYWDKAMNGAPMPKTFKKLLSPEWVDDWAVQKAGQKRIEEACFFYTDPDCEASNVKDLYDPTTSIFFFEKDLQLGAKKNFHFIESSNPANFLPRKVADMVPLSSRNLSVVLDAFFISPTSAQAKEMRHTVTMCESPAIRGQEKACVSSLESMVDFATAKLGRSNNVQALESEIGEEATIMPRSYTVVGLKDTANKKAVVCHKLKYPYAVFNCHTTDTRVYKVSLVGADGTKVKAIGACHHDTSAWSPNHLAFHELNVKPGAAPICHFMPGDHIAFIPK